jgi:2'-5' RNA ligase
MEPAEHYALWLPLPDAVRARMAGLIDGLAARFHAPRFEPHITLLGSIHGAEPELTARCAGLAAGLAPLTVRLSTVGYLDEYFRCLFVRVEPSPPLLRAHETVRQALRPDAVLCEFMPHVSLLYAHLPAGEKEPLLGEIGRRLDLDARIGHLALYAIEGTPGQWRCVASFALAGRPAPGD